MDSSTSHVAERNKPFNYNELSKTLDGQVMYYNTCPAEGAFLVSFRPAFVSPRRG